MRKLVTEKTRDVSKRRVVVREDGSCNGCCASNLTVTEIRLRSISVRACDACAEELGITPAPRRW